MNINKCPSCNIKVITPWKKMSVGPFRKVKCNNCGATVSVAWFPYLISLLLGQLIMLAGGITALLLIKGTFIPIDTLIWQFIALFSAGFIGAFPLSVLINYYLVPVVIKNA